MTPKEQAEYQIKAYSNKGPNLINRIRGFIRTQRYIGANEKLNTMRDRYSKTADDFYKKYGAIYYVNKNGQSIGLNIITTWHFVTLEHRISELESQNKDLTKALEAIRKLTSDEQLPFLKALYTIAHKTLKAVNKK